MSVITLPAAFKPHSCQLTQSVNQRVSAAPFGGSEQAIDLLNDRWLLSCELPNQLNSEGAWREAFIGALRGQVNVVNLYHFARKAPRGTVRGTLTLSAGAAQGASSIVITGCNPATGTLLAGDMLGVGGLLLMVANDCAAVAGVITATITNRLRVAQSSGAAVTWDKPTAAFRLLATNGVGYSPAVAGACSFDFGEKI
ncbi:MAG: hypothetical protein JJD98_00110 [Polaromonas sp.]|nr:hypothetical protein [Polaromonas sp.]